MTRHRVLMAAVGVSIGVTLALTCTASANGVGLPRDYYWHRSLTLIDQARSHAMAADSAGNIYVAGSASSCCSAARARIVQKYRSSGGEVSGPNGAWFVAHYTADYRHETRWQKVVVDEERGRLYILFATQDEDETGCDFTLACHDLQTGEKPWTSTGTGTQSVGHSELHRGGLDVDSEGNVWTVLEEIHNSIPPQAVLQLKRWNGEDGSEMTVSNDGLLWSQHKSKRFIAFGIRPSDGRFYLAYREETEASASVPTADPIDLVMTLWEGDFTFAGRSETSFEVPLPDYYAPELPLEKHPRFHDGYVDTQGRFVVGGYAYFCDNYDFPWGYNTWYYPVVMQFDASLQEEFRFYGYPYVIGPKRNYSARLRPGPDDTILYGLLPVYVDEPDAYKIWAIDQSSDLIESVSYYIDARLEDRPQPLGSDCYYAGERFKTNDFIYLPEGNRENEKMVMTGAAVMWSGISDDPDCPASARPALTMCYNHGGPPPITPVQIAFEWERIVLLAKWVMEHWELVFPPEPPIPPYKFDPEFDPEPQPQPCPECDRSFSAFWHPTTLAPYLDTLYEVAVALAGEPSRVDLIEELVALVEEIPAGPRFTDTMRDSLLTLLGEARLSGTGSEVLPARLTEALNAVDLDWRVPVIPAQTVHSGRNVTADFGGVAWVTFENVGEPITCRLDVKGGLPAAAIWHAPGWPVATYTFDHEGEIPGGMEISFHLGGTAFSGSQALPRLLQWDGASYTDITTRVDLHASVITGTTDTLSSFVVLNDTFAMGVPDL